MEDNEEEENDDNYMSPEYGGNERGEAEHEEADPIIHDDLRGVIVDAHTQADRKSTRLNSSHSGESRMPSSA